MNTINVPVGSNRRLSAFFQDQNGVRMYSEQTITYSSDTPSVATIDDSGVITAVSAGSANIIVASGSLSYTVQVTTYIPVLTNLYAF